TVGEGLHPVHAVGIDTGQVRAYGFGTGRYQQMVVLVLTGRPLVVALAHGDARRARVQRDDLGSHPHVDAALAVLLRRTRDETVRAVHETAEPVRDSACGVGRPRSALEDENLEVVARAPLGGGRGAHAGGVSPDHDQA